jgi:hypothetical protein
MLGALTIWSARIILGLTLAVAAWGKAKDAGAFRQTVVDFDLFPARGARTVAIVLIAAEFLAVAALAAGGGLLVAGFGLALLLLAVYSLALSVALARNARIDCNCFGQKTRPISPFDLVRNLLLLGLGLAGIVLLALDSSSHLPAGGIAVAAAMSVGVTVILVHLADIARILLDPLAPEGEGGR